MIKEFNDSQRATAYESVKYRNEYYSKKLYEIIIPTFLGLFIVPSNK